MLSATNRETLEQDCKRITYVPPAPSIVLSSDIPDLYLKSFTAPETADASLPVEYYLADELSNPHSRTKKQRRWQAKQLLFRNMRTDMLAAELKDAPPPSPA